MKTLNAILIDDEPDSRETLAAYLEKYCPQVNLLAAAEDIRTGRAAIDRHQPELVFLDIEMPYGNAFDLLEQFDEIHFTTIFVTAFSQYAIQALNLSAAHYLLKPIDIDELVIAVEKVAQKINDQQQNRHTEVLLQNISAMNTQQQKIVLPLINGFEIKRVREVRYCEAADNFTCFHFTDGSKSLICRKLKFYEQLLEPLGFHRIHRSTLINLEFVERYIKGKGGRVILDRGQELEVAQSRKKDFLKKMGMG